MRRFLALIVALGLMVAALMTHLHAGSSDLAGTAWGIAGEAGPQARLVELAADARISGSGGCNRFFGSYEQTGESLKISGLSATRRGCEADVMQRERELLLALETVRRFEVAPGDRLRLLGADGALLLELIRKSPE